MAFEKSYDTYLPIVHSPCMHLRSKAMFVTGDRNGDHPDEAGSNYYWCNTTQHVLGPDQLDVDRCNCAPGRGCYCET